MTGKMRIALAFFIALLSLGLYACTQSSPESDAFFKKVGKAFEGPDKNIVLQTLTDFPWDKFCLFKSADSYPYVGYSSYQDYLDKQHWAGNVPRGAYGLIFVFLEKDKVVKEYYQTDNFIAVKGKPANLELASKESFVKFCQSPEGLAFTYDDNQTPSILLISKQKP